MTTLVEDKQKLCVLFEKKELLYRRNRYDILAEILVACEERPRTQSWLLTHLRLSTSSGKKFIDFLVATDLLEIEKPDESGSILYAITVRGLEALRIYYILTKEYFAIQMK